MNRHWPDNDASPDRPGPPPVYERAGRFGWWRLRRGERTWVPWRPRRFRR